VELKDPTGAEESSEPEAVVVELEAETTGGPGILSEFVRAHSIDTARAGRCRGKRRRVAVNGIPAIGITENSAAQCAQQSPGHKPADCIRRDSSADLPGSRHIASSLSARLRRQDAFAVPHDCSLAMAEGERGVGMRIGERTIVGSGQRSFRSLHLALEELHGTAPVGLLQRAGDLAPEPAVLVASTDRARPSARRWVNSLVTCSVGPVRGAFTAIARQVQLRGRAAAAAESHGITPPTGWGRAVAGPMARRSVEGTSSGTAGGVSRRLHQTEQKDPDCNRPRRARPLPHCTTSQ